MAGGLATLNPCGFPFLPAFLSFYVGAEEQSLPRAPNRILQGIAVGLAVTAGFLGLFALVALPITYGARLVAEAVPWAGVGLGVALAALGVVALTGRRVSLPLWAVLHPQRQRRALAMVLFGVGYGIASLGCTLPVSLALIGASLGTDAETSLAAFAAYGVGMAVVLVALSVAAALARGGLARGLRWILPFMNRIAGALLVVAGAYLTYYWLRLEFGPKATLADDPIVGLVTRYTARLQALAGDEGLPVLIGAGVAVALALGYGLWQWRRQRVNARRPAGRAGRLRGGQLAEDRGERP